MREQTTSDAMADLDLIWHSVCDTKETNEAYKRLAALIAERDELRETLANVHRRAVAHPDDNDADRKRNLRIIEATTRETARSAP